MRLDVWLVQQKLVATRSQAESYIKLGQVQVNGQMANKPGRTVGEGDEVVLKATEQYVSRAGLKLASVAVALELDFTDKLVLDVGSSTGGFTDFALRQGAAKVIAVDVGTDQLHPTLRANERIELHEKTDIRQFQPTPAPDIVLIDVSFISLREILPHIAGLSHPHTQVVAMFKPQFEAGQAGMKHKGVIKNDSIRRRVLQDFEQWVKSRFVIQAKADSEVAGAKGNRERFYLLRKASQ